MRVSSRVAALAALGLMATAASRGAAEPAATPAPAPANAAASELSSDEKAVYALGIALWRNLQPFALTPGEVAVVQRAFADAAAGREPVVTIEEARPMLESFRKTRLEKLAAAQKEAGRAYAQKAAAEPGAVASPSGLIYRETLAGAGATPTATDVVRVHYRGALVDGTEFESSFEGGQPAQFSVGEVIPCWSEALLKMKAGGRATIVCPSDLAYGDRGRPSIPPGATLVFDVELLEIVAVPETPEAASE